MPLFLRERNTALKELMDDPNCDLDLLYSTYEQFHTVNKLLGRWKKIYTTHIKPVLIRAGSNASVLDIGCGGGDIIRLLDGFCKQDGLEVKFTGIEPDKRALGFLDRQKWPDNVTFQNITSGKLLDRQTGEYSVVISNHLLHHLTSESIREICNDAEKLASHKVIFSDIERSDMGYLFFKLLAPMLFKQSFIVEDGTRSIRRSFRKEELERAMPDTWHVQRLPLFRLLAVYDGGSQ